MNINKSIKIARIMAGMTQKDVCKKIFTCQATLCHYETSRRVPLDMAIQLADLYNISLDELVGRKFKDK